MVTGAATAVPPPGPAVADHDLLIEAMASDSGHPHLGNLPQSLYLALRTCRQSCHEESAELAANYPVRRVKHRLCICLVSL